jgi:hypothetical protein
MYISVRLSQDDGTLTLTVSGFMIAAIGTTAGPANMFVSGIVPAGATYAVTSTANTSTTLFWYELR